jgi:hypothetical protein
VLEPEEAMTFVQFTRFRLATQNEQVVLEARQASLLACRGTDPELCGAYLVRLADGEWLDIAIWAGQPGMEAFDDPGQAAARAGFYGQIDELIGEECGILIHADTGTHPAYRRRPGQDVAIGGLQEGP